MIGSALGGRGGAGIAAVLLLLGASVSYLALGSDDQGDDPLTTDLTEALHDTRNSIAPEDMKSMDRSAADAEGWMAGQAVNRKPTADGLPIPHEEADLPTLDLVRVDAQGSSVVAGRGRPGAEIIVRLNGAAVATSKADAGGSFVSLFDLDLNDKPGTLTVETSSPGSPVRRAADAIIIAPVVASSASNIETGITAGGLATADERKVARKRSAPADIVATALSDGPKVVTVEGGVAVVAHVPKPSSDAGGEMIPMGKSEALSSDHAELVISGSDPTDGGASPVAGLVISSTAPAATPRLFRAGPDGVAILGSGGASDKPEAALAIDAISYDAAGEVRITGRAAAEDVLRLYLDDAPILEFAVLPDGTWTSPLPGVRSGTYTLRIDAIAPDGAVVSRVETPFQRTAPDIAAAARRNGSTAITVQPGFTLWAISQGYFGSGTRYVQIFEANRSLIRDPDLIFPGQIFALPQVASVD